MTDEDETSGRQPFPNRLCFLTSLAPPYVAALTANSWPSFVITAAVLHAVGSLVVFCWLVMFFKCMNEAFTCWLTCCTKHLSDVE